MPTVCELTGAKLPENVDGVSYLSTLLGKNDQKKHDYLYFEFFEQGGKRTVIKDNWKLVQLDVNKKKETRYELYDIKSDPSETKNLAPANNKKVEELKELMNQSHKENDLWKFSFERE